MLAQICDKNTHLLVYLLMDIRTYCNTAVPTDVRTYPLYLLLKATAISTYLMHTTAVPTVCTYCMYLLVCTADDGALVYCRTYFL